MTLSNNAYTPRLLVCTRFTTMSTLALSLQSLMTCGQSLLEKHTLKYHLTHRAYIQAKVAEMNIISSSGSEGRAKSLQTTLSFAPGSARLGLNDPMEQYQSVAPFSSMNNLNGYNDLVISNTSINAIYELYTKNCRSCESGQLMCSILGNYFTVHAVCKVVCG